ncbi:hypothetical protein O181_092802 [Austropuccinia psidii MF-1]|uniref:Uncharacterized protein n=1 Tax=Austropuccinia psidii MF-1 TaxID=1389203 RepID=A0A9Q3P9Y4_9BASI|nr:hypothetical protein [Austropuccinia psidii MF-1]
MRQNDGKHSWPWWKEQIISKWANDSWRFKIENSFEEAIFNIERDRPMSWFLKQKDILTALPPDMSETLVNKRILRECSGDLEHAIRRRCIEHCSTEDYINAIEDITTRKKLVEIAPLRCHKCGSTSYLANTCPKKTRINEIEIEKDDTKETKYVSLHESDSEPSEEGELPDETSIEKISVSFEVTEVHTHLPQYSDECMDLIHVQDAKMQKAKPATGKGYTAGSSCITNIVINNREAKIHLDSGYFCNFVGKDYLDKIYTNWKDKLTPIESIKFSSASQNMHPLGIFEAAMIFHHPTGNRSFTIGENKRQKFAFPPEKREITVIRQVKNFNKEKFVSDQLIEAQINPELKLEMKEELIEIFFQYRQAFASDNEPLGAIKGHEVDIMLNVERPYPPLSRRTAYPASPRAREALENHINELMKL